MAVTTALTLMLVVTTWGQVGPLPHLESLNQGVDTPARVAVAPDGTVLITDPTRNRILRFDAASVPLSAWIVPEGPVGIGAHPDGRFFVSLQDVPQVGVYDATLTRTGFLGEGNPMVSFVRPTAIAISDSTGKVYVVDSGGDRVYGFAGDGTLALMTGIRGELPGQLQFPSAIAVDEGNNRLVVADHDNFRIQIFSTTGLFLQRFGYRMKYVVGGTQEGWMPRTLGLAVDAAGRIYVADAMMSTVRIFDQTGTELGKVLQYGSAPGDLRTPGGLALSNDESKLYVVSANTSSVEVYTTPTLGAGADLASARPDQAMDPPGTNRSLFDVIAANTLTPMVKRNTRAPMRQDASSVVAELQAVDPLVSVSQAASDGPHIIQASVICGRCHGIDGQPGGHPGLLEGQNMLCFSCHSGAGQSSTLPIHESDVADPFGTNPAAIDGKGTSHAWGVPAVNAMADAVGPVPGSAMDQELVGGLILCSTCHDEHTSEAGWPYLRRSNTGDGMCKECHSARNRGPGQGGSHAVGFDYPGGVGEFPATSSIVPLVLKDAKVECLTCHDIHNVDSGGANGGAGDGMLLRVANDETLCQTCHTGHIGHTPSGSWQPTCQDCHAVHDVSNTNLSLVGATVHNRTLGVDKTVVFAARDGVGSFDDGDPALNDGICQVCHTVTTYHKHDGTGTVHNDGATCTVCHPHDAGFMPTGGDCTSCHSVAQDNGDGIPVGGRRAVVGEFPVADAHAHYGVDLDNNACRVCHDQSTHMDGNVDLIDPDDGSLYTFVSPDQLTSDPDLSDFCAGCHDADGAVRLGALALDPFGNGNVPPPVAERFQGTLQWEEEYGDFCFGTEGNLRPVNSHHDISDADQAFSGAKIECLSCHGAHTASQSQPISDPFNTTTAWAGDGNGFCLSCHAGGASPVDPGFPSGVVGPIIDVTDPRWSSLGMDWCEILDGACAVGDCSSLRGVDSRKFDEGPWWVQYTWTHEAHGLDSKRGWNGYSGATAYDMDCQVCHDPHGSYSATNTAGNPYMIRDVVDGSAFEDDGSLDGGFNGPPFTTFGTSREVVVPVSGIDVGWGSPQGLCEACHAGWVNSMWAHGMCSGCQTCHGHGMAWGAVDAVDYNSDTPLPFNDTCERGWIYELGGAHGPRLKVDAPRVEGNTNALDDSTPICGTDSPRQGLWYAVAGTGGTLTVSTCQPGTTFDTSLQVFCGCDLVGCVGGNDDDASCALSPTSSTFSWCSDPDQLYSVHVGGSGASSGVFELLLTDDGIACGSAPACTPDIGACCVGETNTANNLRTECDGLGGDWYLGEDCATFTCPPLGACCDAGESCVATNTQAQCTALGGTWTTGQDCATFACPAPGLAPQTPASGGVAKSAEPLDMGPGSVPMGEGATTRPLHKPLHRANERR